MDDSIEDEIIQEVDTVPQTLAKNLKMQDGGLDEKDKNRLALQTQLKLGLIKHKEELGFIQH